MTYTNLSPQRQERRFEMLDQLDRKLRNGPEIGPVDMRSSLEKMISAIVRSGNCVFIEELRA